MQNKLVKKLCAVVLSGTMILSILPQGAAWADEANSPLAQAKAHFAKSEQEESLHSGIIKGDEKGNLHLNETITRAEFMAMVNRSLGLSEKSSQVERYQDVASGAWYKDEVAKALAAGYIAGTSKNTMSPMATLTNEQVYAILSRLGKKVKGTIDTSAIKDFNRISSWAKDGVTQAAIAGWVIEDNGQLNPQKGASRGQVARVLNRYQTDKHVLLFSGNYTFQKAKSIAVLAENVVIENSDISGDVKIAKGIKKVTLTKTTVKGKITPADKATKIEGIAKTTPVSEEPASDSSSSSSSGGSTPAPETPSQSLLGADEKIIRSNSDALLKQYLLKGDLENGEYDGAKSGFQGNGVIKSNVQIDAGKISKIKILPYTDGVSDTTSYRVYAIHILPFLQSEQGRQNIAMMSLFYKYVTDLDVIQDDTALYNKAKEILGKKCAEECRTVPKSAHARMTTLSSAVKNYLTHEYTKDDTVKMFDAISGATLSASGMARSVGHALSQSIHDKKTGNDIRHLEIIKPTYRKFFANQKDPLHLDGLTIKLTKKDGSSREIGVNDFAAQGIEMAEESSQRKITNGMIMRDYNQGITVDVKDLKSERIDKFDIIVNENYDENWVCGMQYKVEGKDWETVPSPKMQAFNLVNPYQVNNIEIGQVIDLNKTNAKDYIGKKLSLRLVLKHPIEAGNEASKYVPLYTNLKTKDETLTIERNVENKFYVDKTAYKSLNINFLYKLTFNAPEIEEPGETPETPGIEDYSKIVDAKLIREPEKPIKVHEGDSIDPSVFAIEIKDENGAKEVIGGEEFAGYTEDEGDGLIITMTPSPEETLTKAHNLKKVKIKVTAGDKTFNLESKQFIVVQQSLLGADEKMIRTNSDALLKEYLLKGDLENGEYDGAKSGFQGNGVIKSNVQIEAGKINKIKILPYTDGVSDTTSYRVYAIHILPFLQSEQGRQNIAMMSLFYKYVTDLDVLQDDTALYNKAKEILGKKCAEECRTVPKDAHGRMTTLSSAVKNYLTHEYTEDETVKMFDAVSGATLSASGMARSVGHALEQSIHDKKTGNDVRHLEIITPTYRKFFANKKDPLHLDELKIKMTKKDGQTEEIGVNEFEANGIEMYEEESKHKITNGMVMKDYNYAITVIIKDTKSARTDKFDIIVDENYDENWVVGMQYKVEGKDWENVPNLKMQDFNPTNPYQVNNIAPGQVVELNEDNAKDYLGKKVELRVVLKNPSQAGNEESKYVPLYTNLKTKDTTVVIERGVEHRFNPDKDVYKSSNVSFFYKITFNAPKSSDPENPGIEDYSKVVKAKLIKDPNMLSLMFKKGATINPSLFAIELEDEKGVKEVIEGKDFADYAEDNGDGLTITMTPAEGEALSEKYHKKKVIIKITAGEKTFTLESKNEIWVQ